MEVNFKFDLKLAINPPEEKKYLNMALTVLSTLCLLFILIE